MLRKLHLWLQNRLGIDEIVEQRLTGYLLPSNITVWHSLGSLLMAIFAIQVVTGILLLVYYVPDADKAFRSITTIMNEVPFGWLIRLCHAVGSHMMIVALFLHMLSVLVMGSYKSPRELNWLSGFILLNLVMAISLTGYLLPWSQLSFWATTVATSSAGALPFIGDYLVEFLRGGKDVGPPTLARFFTLHVTVLPAGIIGLVGMHLFILQRTGIATPPFGRNDTINHWQGECYRYEGHPGGIPFFPHQLLHDLTIFAIYLAVFLGVVFFAPYLFFPVESFVTANPLQTPARIKPEWYFLPNYQILRIFPNELLGLAVQGAAISFLALFPFIDRGRERHPLKRPLFLVATIGGIITFIVLMVWGYYS